MNHGLPRLKWKDCTEASGKNFFLVWTTMYLPTRPSCFTSVNQPHNALVAECANLYSRAPNSIVKAFQRIGGYYNRKVKLNLVTNYQFAQCKINHAHILQLVRGNTYRKHTQTRFIILILILTSRKWACVNSVLYSTCFSQLFLFWKPELLFNYSVKLELALTN